MKIETHMATTSTAHTTTTNTTTAHNTNVLNTNVQEVVEEVGEKEEGETDPNLVKWEEWALSAEEHVHALNLHRANPTRPMGHK
jgi:multimeric flavodoxin WrbA